MTSTLRVLVTGASRGLGLELVRQFVARGDQVFAAVRTPQSGSAAGALGATVVPLDVDDEDSIREARRVVGELTHGLDVLVNNAGVSSGSAGLPPKPTSTELGKLTAASLLRMFRSNAIGPLLVSQAFVDLLERGRDPKVACISSGLASISMRSSGGNYGYCASKAALNMVTRALANDLKPRGITAIVMTPGWVKTDMGGPNAPLTAATSAAGILDVLARTTLADSGRFVDWTGADQPF